MKKQLTTTLLLFSHLALFTACSGTVSPLTPDLIPPPSDNKPADPETPAGSPYTKKVSAVVGGIAKEYAYVEAIDRADGKNVELRFFTIPPRGLCNSSTFTDSSFYQSKFSYVSVRINKTPSITAVNRDGTVLVGKRGESFPEDTRDVSGEITLAASTDDHYTGWLKLTAAQGVEIQGNFDVVGCNQTHSLLKKMNLDNLSETVTLRYKSSGATAFDIRIDSSYRINSESSYGGYKTISDYHSLSIWSSSSYGLKAGFYGMSGGTYIGAGNTSCTSDSPGPVTAEIVGNRVYFGGQRPFFCKFQYPDTTSTGFFEYNPATGVRTIELETKQGTLVGEL